MHRIDTPSRQKDKFGAGKDGFTNGDPQTGAQATQVPASWLDALQEEIAAVIEMGGDGAKLDKSKHNQLLAAIKEIGKSGEMEATEGTRGTMKIATALQTSEGDADNVAITPKKLRLGVSFYKSSGTGYVALPSWLGGFIFQFGKKEVVANSAQVTFPIAFPTAVGAVIPIKQSASVGVFITPDNIGLASFTAYGWSAVNTPSPVNTIWWFAIGY